MNSTCTGLLCVGGLLWWYQEPVVQAIVIAAFVVLGLVVLLAMLHVATCFLRLLPSPPPDGRLRPGMRPVPVYRRF